MALGKFHFVHAILINEFNWKGEGFLGKKFKKPQTFFLAFWVKIRGKTHFGFAPNFAN